MSVFRSRLPIRLALGCLVGVIGCTTHQSASRSFSLPKIAKPAVSKVAASKLAVANFKLPELKSPLLPKPAFGSKFSEDSADKKPQRFKLVSTGKPRQAIGRTKSPGQSLGNPSPDARHVSTTPDSKSNDTMALIDEASESVQGAFAQSMPLADQALAGQSFASVHNTLQPRDAGSAPDQFRDISEAEMLHIALSQSPVLRSLGIRILENPQAATTIYDVAINQSDPFFGPDAALAEFDSVLSASVNTQNNDRVFNNATLGGEVQELTQDLVNLNAGWQRRTMTGATWEISSLTGYDNNNRAGNRFGNYWETQVEAGVRQPLLQGAGRQFNRIAGPNARPGFNFSNGIVIAQMNNQISQADFEIALRSYVRDLYSAYWELVRQYAVYDSVVASQDLAYETWQSILAKSKAELEGGEANKEAQARAKYYNYRREVQIALGGESGRGGLYIAERGLRQLVGLPAVDGMLLRPTDTPVTARYVFDYDHLVARAMGGRTELRRQNTRVRQQQLRLIAAKNFLLPQLDLIGRYRLRGFGDDLTGSGPRFSSAYDDFASLDHQEWEFGVEMGVTAGRRQAHAAVRNAKLQLSREQVLLNEQQRAVRHQVSEAFADVSSAYFAMESSLQQAAASKERLRASEALYAADKIQIEFLLDAQEELLRAELQLASDQARYSISLVEINNTSGTLLNDIGVNIAQRTCGTHVCYLPTAGTTTESLQQVPAVPATSVSAAAETDQSGDGRLDNTPPTNRQPDLSEPPVLLPPPPIDSGDDMDQAAASQLELLPAPVQKPDGQLIKTPPVETSLKQFFQRSASLPQTKVPMLKVPSFSAPNFKPPKFDVPALAVKSFSLPAKPIGFAKKKLAGDLTDQQATESNQKSATSGDRVLAKPKYTAAAASIAKTTETKSKSRFKLPRFLRNAN